ncbi:MAG: hypothetical protein Q9160_002892 [Pyrenula sp. 1 TL-2023]
MPPSFSFGAGICVLLALNLLIDQSVHSEDLPFGGQCSQKSLGTSPLYTGTKRVAIIGAGSAGSSTAYYLKDRSPIPVNITIFETSDYVGGRSTTVNAFDDPAYPAELGASIFVRANKNLVSAAERFGLVNSKAFSERPKESKYDLGIWTGSEFIFREGTDGNWWSDVAKLLWRYGLAPILTQRLMKSTVDKFLKMYEEPYFPFADLSETVEAVGLLDFTGHTGQEVLERAKIGQKFSTEIIQSSTRVNYGQNLGVIHGLETMVCMATDGAMAIDGGNWQIFDHMIRASGAHLRLNTTVSSIDRHEDGHYTLTYQHSAPEKDTSAAETDDFDVIVLTAPYHSSGLDGSIKPSLINPPDKIPYVTLHVTLLTSPHKLSPKYFNARSADEVPEMVITTLPTGMDTGLDRDHAVGPSVFWSVSTLATVPRVDKSGQVTTHYLYKIFSPDPANSTLVSQLLGFDLGPSTSSSISGIPSADVSWSYVKEWKSYPYELPRVTFENLKLDDHQLYYTNAIEPFISTMETSSLMGSNIAALIANQWEGDMARPRDVCTASKFLKSQG